MYAKQDCSAINKSQEELNRKITVQHNLQNPRLIREQTNIKAELVTYTIPSIVNGRLSRENVSESANLMILLLKRSKLNTLKESASVAHRRHKILMSLIAMLEAYQTRLIAVLMMTLV
jgi:hypothetical protein